MLVTGESELPLEHAPTANTRLNESMHRLMGLSLLVQGAMSQGAPD